MSLYAMLHVNSIVANPLVPKINLEIGKCFPLTEETFVNDYDAKIKPKKKKNENLQTISKRG